MFDQQQLCDELRLLKQRRLIARLGRVALVFGSARFGVEHSSEWPLFVIHLS